MRRIATRHPKWQGFLLLSEKDGSVLHEGPRSRGKYLLEGSRLVVTWDRYAPEEFLEVDGVFIYQKTLVDSLERDERTATSGADAGSVWTQAPARSREEERECRIKDAICRSEDREQDFKGAITSLRALASDPPTRRIVSRCFDAGLSANIGDGRLLPSINCFYEVIDPSSQHLGLVAAVRSMRAAGHTVRVWTYSPERLAFLLLEGVELAPAAQVVPSQIFQRAGVGIRYFSDLFRYALLYEQGGVWMDTDIVLLRSFPYIGDYFFNLQWTDPKHVVCGNVLVAPPRSLHFRRLYDAALDRVFVSTPREFGDIGPELLSNYIFSDEGQELRKWVFSPVPFNSIDFKETALLNRPLCELTDYLNDERVFGVHLWNKITEAKKRDDRASLLSTLSDTPRTLPSFIELAELANTDKNNSVGNRHFYSRVYQALLSSQRFAVRRLLEIGLCRGRAEGWAQGETPSIDLWLNFFPFCEVIGVDLTDFSRFNNARFTSHVCDQSVLAQVENVAATIEPDSIDVVIDDGSHASYDQQMTFRVLFSRLAPGGWYFIEDLDWQPPGEDNSRIALTKDLFASLQDANKTGRIDSQGLAALREEMAEIHFFDSHFELSHRGRRGGLLAVRRRGAPE